MPDRPSPFEEIEELFEQLNSGFSEMGDRIGNGVHIDVAETDDSLVVTADVPGFDPDDIDVSVQDRRLTIAADDEETEEAADDETYLRRERTNRAVSRSITLPTEVEGADASASYENGVLTVELPKAAEDGGVSINIG